MLKISELKLWCFKKKTGDICHVNCEALDWRRASITIAVTVQENMGERGLFSLEHLIECFVASFSGLKLM